MFSVTMLTDIVFLGLGFTAGWKLNQKKHEIKDTFNNYVNSRKAGATC